MQSALKAIRVLDLSRLLPGPFCSMLLADMGAEVIKVEAPKIGDYIRWWKPHLGKNSGMHVIINRNKKSITLNLKKKEGTEIFLRLVKKSDVVLEGFRPGVMEKLGLGYKRLAEINPRIIYCSISGYGHTGPMSERAGHDINFLALSGVLSYCGLKGKPSVLGVQVADIGGGGLLAAFSILAALMVREKSGQGQSIDVSMTDGAMLWNCLRFGNWIADGIVPSPGDGMLNGGFACYNVYETKDGRFMALGALEPQFWESFCDAIGRPDLKTPQYFEAGDHQQALIEELSSIFKKKTQAEWISVFREVDCCCEPVLNLEEATAYPLFREREMILQLKHSRWGSYSQIGVAPKFSRTPGSLRNHAPELGEHTDKILQEIGLTEKEIEKLKKENII